MTTTTHLMRTCPGCAHVAGYEVLAKDGDGVACRLWCRRCARVFHVEASGIWEARTPCDRCLVDCELSAHGRDVYRLEPPQAGWRVLCATCHQAWRNKLSHLITLVSRYPEGVVDAFLKMAEAAGTPPNSKNGE